MQSIILGSFFYGYVITQIPAGYLAGQKIVSCKWLFGFGILFTSIFTVLMPLAAKTHYYLLLAIRVLEGMFLAFLNKIFVTSITPFKIRNNRSLSKFIFFFLDVSLPYF